MFNNKCVICGKEFQAKQRNYITCSPECRKINNLTRQNQWDATHVQERKQYARRRCEKLVKRPAFCKICGKPVTKRRGALKIQVPKFHEKCVMFDIFETMDKGKPLNKAQLLRMYARGYNVEEIRDMYIDWYNENYEEFDFMDD